MSDNRSQIYPISMDYIVNQHAPKHDIMQVLGVKWAFYSDSK